MKFSFDKIKIWIKRYGPWEIFGTTFALAGWFIASRLTDNNAIIGYVGAWSENIGYYWYFLWREKRDQRVLFNKKASTRQLAKWLISEFWPWEILDSLVVRPLTMGTGAKYLGWLWLVLWKWAADIVFYTCTTILFWQKTRRNVDVRLQALSAKISGKWE